MMKFVKKNYILTRLENILRYIIYNSLLLYGEDLLFHWFKVKIFFILYLYFNM